MVAEWASPAPLAFVLVPTEARTDPKSDWFPPSKTWPGNCKPVQALHHHLVYHLCGTPCPLLLHPAPRSSASFAIAAVLVAVISFPCTFEASIRPLSLVLGLFTSIPVDFQKLPPQIIFGPAFGLRY